MTIQLSRKTVLLAKIESNYGTDPTPTVGSNAILCSDPKITPVGDILERDFVTPSLSRYPHITGTRRATVTFTTELKTDGAAGDGTTRPEIDPLLRACGLAASLQAEAGGDNHGYESYAPVSTGFESVTLYVYEQDVLHKVSGCVGTFTMKFPFGKYPTIDWTFSGLYGGYSDSTPGTPTYNAALPKIVASETASIGGFAAIMSNVEISMNNEIVERPSINATYGLAGYRITGRNPGGRFDPEADTEALGSFWTNYFTMVQMALLIQHNKAESPMHNSIKISAPKVQYTGMGYGDRGGIQTLDTSFALRRNSGDDELVILFGYYT